MYQLRFLLIGFDPRDLTNMDAINLQSIYADVT